MRVKKLLVIALLALPMMGMAQSSYGGRSGSNTVKHYDSSKTSRIALLTSNG